MKTIITFSILFFSLCISAQDLQTSNVYYFTFLNQNQTLKFSKALYLTDFNSYGYNNQPNFIDDNTIILSSNHYDENQADIIKLDLLDKTMKRLTQSPDGEFSPSYHSKLRAMSTVKLSQNQDHNLHIYKTNAYSQGYSLLKDFNNIEYYVWDKLNEDKVYFVTTSQKLMEANVKTKESKIILENVGRTLKVNSEGLLYFVHKVNSGGWYIKTYDPVTKKIDLIVRTLRGKEDFELIKGTIISGSGSLIYQHVLNQSEDWKRMGDLSEFGIKNIARLNIRKNKLLIVDKSKV